MVVSCPETSSIFVERPNLFEVPTVVRDHAPARAGIEISPILHLPPGQFRTVRPLAESRCYAELPSSSLSDFFSNQTSPAVPRRPPGRVHRVHAPDGQGGDLEAEARGVVGPKKMGVRGDQRAVAVSAAESGVRRQGEGHRALLSGVVRDSRGKSGVRVVRLKVGCGGYAEKPSADGDVDTFLFGRGSFVLDKTTVVSSVAEEASADGDIGYRKRRTLPTIGRGKRTDGWLRRRRRGRRTDTWCWCRWLRRGRRTDTWFLVGNFSTSAGVVGRRHGRFVSHLPCVL